MSGFDSAARVDYRYDTVTSESTRNKATKPNSPAIGLMMSESVRPTVLIGAPVLKYR